MASRPRVSHAAETKSAATMQYLSARGVETEESQSVDVAYSRWRRVCLLIELHRRGASSVTVILHHFCSWIQIGVSIIDCPMVEYSRPKHFLQLAVRRTESDDHFPETLM
ncbi:uncharacterized protein N7511_004258 [Penicillium nucicola]|uniref:uncharacterized protein n=1 Tax=Penicillium nucicola TaxID=1850975 RepID=UPI0025450336|nr:uncharacterized protein N7511_004258 [Penicillium nucicola]KAJ5766642.1 hypothetical protein N7511_004258 [Penicillium nucicola]